MESEKQCEQSPLTVNVTRKNDKERAKMFAKDAVAEKTFWRRKGTAGAGGHFFEIKMLMLLKIRLEHEAKGFHMAAGMVGAYDLDDIVVKYTDATNTQKIILVQAKHRVDALKSKITVERFNANCDLDLQKYFKSYLKIRYDSTACKASGNILSGAFKTIQCLFVFLTNALTDESLREFVDLAEDRVEIVQTTGSAEAFRLRLDKAKELLSGVEIAIVADKFVACLTSNNFNAMLHDDQLKAYRRFFVDTVIKGEGNNWEMRREFVEGECGDQLLQKFRNCLIDGYAKCKIAKSGGNAKTRDLTIAQAVDHIVDSLIDKEPECAINDWISKMNTVNTESNPIVYKEETGKLVFAYEECLEEMTNDILLGAKRRDEEKIGRCRNILMEVFVKLRLRGKKIKFSGNFGADKRERLQQNLDAEEHHIKDFIACFVICAGQRNERELEDLIKVELRTTLRLTVNDVNDIYHKLCTKMTNWWTGSGEIKYLTKDDDFFPVIAKQNIRFNVRPPVKSFTGRENELRTLHEDLKDSADGNRTCVISQMKSISGLGGIGKSELARKYAQDYGEFYDGNVVWIDAETLETTSRSFRVLCKDILGKATKDADGGEKDMKVVVQEVYRFFENRKCLFIFDNAERFNSADTGNGVMDFMSRDEKDRGIHYLITSRNRLWPNTNTLELLTWSAEEAALFVRKSLDVAEDGAVGRLVETLQNFPLALQQAVAYIRAEDNNLKKYNKKFEIRDYLKAYEGNAQRVLDSEFGEGSVDSYTRTTYTTWQTTVNMLGEREHGADAISILNVVAYLTPNDIPVTMISKMRKDERTTFAALDILDQYSLVTVRDNLVNVHRLVQHVTRMKNRHGEGELLRTVLGYLGNERNAKKYVDQAKTIWEHAMHNDGLVLQFSFAPNNIVHGLNSTWRYQEAYSVGTKYVGKLKAVGGVDQLSLVKLQLRLALAMNMIGKHEEALRSYREELEKQTEMLGPRDPDTLSTKYHIGWTLSKMGRHEEASGSFKEVLAEQTEILGPNNALTLATLSKVAVTLSDMGRHEEALRSYREVLKKRTEILGPSNPSVLDIQINIAATLSKMGKREEALRSYREIWKKQTEMLGPRNPSILVTQHNIALTLSKMGRFSEALRSFREVLEKRTQILGPDNPATLAAQHNIAVMLSKMGKHAEALRCCREILKKRTEILGPYNPCTLDTQHEVAVTLAKMGQYGEALRSYREVLEKRTEKLGPRNLSTLVTQHNIGLTLSRMGKFEEALGSFREVLEKRTEILGPNNLCTLVTQNEVAVTLSKMGKHEEALRSFREVLVKRTETLGAHDMSTLFTQHQMGITLSQMGRHEEALRCGKEVLDKHTETFGPDNLFTLTIKCFVASTLSKMGRFEEALESFREVLEKRNEVLGPRSPSTLTTQHEISLTLSRMGNHDEALRSYRELLGKRAEILGPYNPSTLSTQHEMAVTLSKMGEHEEALRSYGEVLEKRTKVLGEHNLSTLTTRQEMAVTFSKMGKHEEALRSYKEVLEKRTEILGPNHRSTLYSQQQMAITLSKLGEHEEALRCCRQVLERRKLVSGADHPDTIKCENVLDKLLKSRPSSRWDLGIPSPVYLGIALLCVVLIMQTIMHSFFQ